MRILTAPEIEAFANKGVLFRSGFRKSNCDTMFYSLTLGHKVLSITKNETEFRELTGPLVLGPCECVNVEVMERFNFQDEVGAPRYGGLIVSVARLLAGGIAHPATVIDPGFDRGTYITLVNLRSYPGPRLFPGKDKIAKMLIFEYNHRETLPPAWEVTPAYELAGQDEMPTYWPTPAEPWNPVSRTTVQDIEQLASLGAPYDLIAAALKEDVSKIEDARQRLTSVESSAAQARESVAHVEQQLAALLAKLSDACGQAESNKREVDWYKQRLEHLEGQVNKKLEEHRFRISQWLLLAITVVATLFASLVFYYWADILKFLQKIF